MTHLVNHVVASSTTSSTWLPVVIAVLGLRVVIPVAAPHCYKGLVYRQAVPIVHKMRVQLFHHNAMHTKRILVECLVA